MEPQATLDSAASLERKGLMSSPPSINASKDLDMSEMVTRLSSNTATAGILAPRAPATSTQQYDQTVSKFQPNFPAQLNQAQVSNDSSDRSQPQQEQQAGLQPTALRRVRVAGASAGCSRSGSEPPAFTPSSPANAAHNAYLVSISDDFVAPLSAFKEGIQPSNKSTKPAAAVAGGQKQKLAPVVSGSEESCATASRSSGGTSTDDNRSASASPSAAEDVTGEPAAATDSGVPASSSSKPPCSPARIDLGAVRQQLQQHQLAQQQQAAGVSSVRKHQLLAAEPSTSEDTTAASNVPTAADVRPRRPSALYTSPMQHITVSVKVPNAFAPATARSLQNVVAQHVVSAAAAQQPPQHTIMHMVAVPGCIQLLIDVVNYQQAVQPTDSAPAVSASAAAAAASRLSLMTSLRDSVQSLYADAVSQASFDDDHGVMESSQSPDAADLSSTDPVGDVAPLVNSSHAVSRSAAAASASGLIAQQAPAPPWMIKAVCEAVQEFMQSHACELTAAVNNGVNGAATSGANQSAAAAAAAAEAAASAVAGNGSSNSNAFESVNASSQLQRSEAHADPTTAVITFNGESYRLLPAASSPGTPWQLQAIGSASEDNNGSSSRAAANTAWLRASGHGSDSRDLSHLLPPLMPLTAVHADAAAAADDDQAGDDHDQHDDQKWSLPDAIWVWPLCLAVQGDSSSRVDVWQPVTVPTSVSAASASASSVIQLHGLNGDSVRLVVTNAAGDVAADCICQLNKGVARIAPAASRSMSRCTIYCIAQPDTAPAASQTAAAAAAGGGALECATVQFALPVLYLPGSVVDELHEAARKIMLEQSRARWLLQHAAVVGTDAAADSYYCYLTDCLPESGGSSSGGASADATAEVGDCELGLATAAPRYGISSSSRIAGSHSRHVGSFATQPAPGSHTVAAAAAGWGTLFPELFGEVHQGQQNSSSTRQQQQQQGQSSSGNDGSGHGSSNSSKLTLEEEDAAHYVNLRGRLFDGVDVHQLLQEQFLAVLSDLGLLIDLTSGPTAAAAAAVRVGGSLPLTAGHDDSAMYVDAGLDRVTAVSGAAAAAASRVDASQLMAAAVGEQLLTWAGGCNCWFCCQLVLSMMLDLGVELVLQNTPVTRRHISTVGDVQALLLGHPANSDAAAAAAAAPTRDVALGDHASGVASAVSTAPSHDEIQTPLQQITAAKGPPANESASDVATVAPSQHQQRMHAFVESRLNNTAAVSSSDIPLHQWHSTAYATRRGRSSSRAVDQTRASAAAAAAAAIAGNMPGSAALGHKKISVRTDVAADSHVVKPGHNAPVAAAAAHPPAVTFSTVNSNPGMNQEVSAADGGYAATRDQSRSFASVSSMPLAPPGCVIHTLPSVGDHPQSAAATAAGDADVNFGDQQVHNNRGSRKLRLSIKDSASEMIHRLMRRKLSPGEHKDEHSAQLGELSHTAAASTE